MNNIVSVIIPVYNVAKYLRKCLDSVLVQTYSDIEIVLVDDGSTDASGAICNEYAASYSRVCAFHLPNGGANAARKYGLEQSSGEYVYFIDSDDTIEPDTVEQALALMTPALELGGDGENPGCDLIIANVKYYHIEESIYEDGRIDPLALAAISRLAGNDYAKIGEQFTMERPL